MPALWEPESTPSNGKLLAKAYINNLRKPAQIVRMGREMLSSRKRVKEGLAQGDFQELGEIPTTRFNGKLSPHRVVGATKFDFEAIREIKNSVEGATINDTVCRAGPTRRIACTAAPPSRRTPPGTTRDRQPACR